MQLLSSGSVLRRPLGFWLSFTLLVAAGCQDSTPPGGGGPEGDVGTPIGGDDATDFVSHVPGQSSAGGEATGGSTGGADGDAAAPEAGVTRGGGDSAKRAIVEADIIQLDGDTLYALSRYAGMTIIDVSTPRELKVLGRYRSSAEPFEMYLRDGVAYIMFNGFSTYVYDEKEEQYIWQTTARMQALDVSDPSRVELIADHEVPGDISDSRLVGDVLYLVTYQTGWCWHCDRDPSTRITSFNVSQRDRFARIDQLSFPSSDRGWGPRSVSANNQRMYVAGDGWDAVEGEIDVIDISDAGGSLQRGARVTVAGQIQSRWQMEEYEGVLRVISQRGRWGSDSPPVLETFRVQDADDLQPLASLEMVLPRPEDLRSVRFDGDRAYAVTFERTDPLFTFDLTDPAAPQQLGELEIPGWLYHMEPRGDRLYALGYDNGFEGGALHVSLFDVSVLSEPTMLSRVNFGGDWGGFAEDQDRIHKAFNIMEDIGLIAVPFHGGSYDDAGCSYTSHSGIQLIDIGDDALIERGVAPQRGQARRAMLHEGKLFGVSDDAVQVFDIADRGAPAEIGRLDVARNISAVRVRGDRMLRLSQDWWTQETTLDHVGLDNLQSVEGDGTLDLSALLQDDRSCYGGSYWSGQMFVHDRYAYLPRYSYANYQRAGRWRHENLLKIFVIDLEAKGGPRVEGSFDAEPSGEGEWFDRILLTDSALLVGRSSGNGYYDDEAQSWVDTGYSYDIFALGDGSAPRFVQRFELPGKLASGGWGHMQVGCGMWDGWGYWYRGWGSGSTVVSEDVVVSQHLEPLDDGTGRVRYYLDRLDVSNPDKPRLLTEVNIPGNVVHYDHSGARLVTIDFELSEKKASDWRECLGRYSYFEESEGVCRHYQRRVNALVLEGDTARRVSLLELERDAMVRGLGVSDQRLVYIERPLSEAPSDRVAATAHALAFGSDGRLRELSKLPLDDRPHYWGQDLQVIGKRAFWNESNELKVLDTSDPAQLTFTRHEMPGWSCNSLEVNDDHAYCAMGKYGVLDIPL